MVLLLWIVIGAMAGWAIGELMPNSEFGLAGHIMIGIIGALFGGYCFEVINIPAIGSLMTALKARWGWFLPVVWLALKSFDVLAPPISSSMSPSPSFTMKN